MLELARMTPDVVAESAWPYSAAGGFAIGVACSSEELEAIQRLRYSIFTDELNVVFPNAVDGLDCDYYDTWCEHLMVKEIDTGRVVGTYRLLTPANAVKAGGYYSESEFDISSLASVRGSLVEVGRSCIHADYRNGSVIMLLLSGVARRVHDYGARYVLGCASVSLRDDGVTAAEVWRVASKALHKASELPVVVPRHCYPLSSSFWP